MIALVRSLLRMNAHVLRAAGREGDPLFQLFFLFLQPGGCWRAKEKKQAHLC
jgi:hypothetical protein